MSKLKKWYRGRKYPHFDKEVSHRWISNYVGETETNRHDAEKRISQHAFYPFIKVIKRTPQYRLVVDEQGNESRKIIPKSRPICYAAHKDAHLLSFYSRMLGQYYEHFLSMNSFNECVIAYRSLDKKNNIHFAHEVFENIRSRPQCVALAFDISKFFQHLNHQKLKEVWLDMIGIKQLPPDYYNIYRNLTKYSYVKLNRLRKLFPDFFSQSRFDQQYKRICSPKQFRQLVRANGLIIKHEKDIGIPQGTPISALLSNIYMISFDKAIDKITRAKNDFYRRYSDDIVIVCSHDDISFYESFVSNKLQCLDLSIHPDKIERVKFEKDRNGIISFERLNSDLQLPFQYLGFEFDGVRSMIRPKSMTRYYRRMQRRINRDFHYVKLLVQHGKAKPSLWRQDIYKKYSHVGRRNFVRYAVSASNIMNEPAIKGQVRRHWKVLNRELKKADRKLHSIASQRAKRLKQS